jgi:PGF-CTERM protein
MQGTPSPTSALSLVAGLLVLAAMATAPVATTHTADDAAHPALTIALEPDGSATVTVWLTFDLETDAEREAFTSLEDDAEAKTQERERFTARMARVAADASNATGREMRVENATIAIERVEDGQIGVVTFTLDWTNLASVEDDRLVLTEPFASDYIPDRTVTVRAPDGYRIAQTTPDPDLASDRQASWETGTDLDGFEVVAVESGSGGVIDGSAPGFGVIAGLVGTLGAVLLARRWRD